MRLRNYIQRLSEFFDIKKNKEILLIIEAPKEIQLAVALEKEVIYSEPKRLVAYGSSVTKGRSATINYCPNITAGHVILGSNLRHFTVIRKINFCSTRQFSTTKSLKAISFNGSESIIIVNSTINKLNFINNQSILLLPRFYFYDYSILEKSFSIVCSSFARFVTQATEPLELPPPHLLVGSGFGHETKLKKRGKYKFEFYLYVELKSDFPKYRAVYYRKSGNKFVQGFDLTAGYINVFSVPTSCPSINTLRQLYYHINNQLKPFDVKTNKEVLLIIEAPDVILRAEALKEVIYNEPEKAVAYGSSVTKGSSASYKIDSTACAS